MPWSQDEMAEGPAEVLPASCSILRRVDFPVAESPRMTIFTDGDNVVGGVAEGVLLYFTPLENCLHRERSRRLWLRSRKSSANCGPASGLLAAPPISSLQS